MYAADIILGVITIASLCLFASANDAVRKYKTIAREREQTIRELREKLANTSADLEEADETIDRRLVEELPSLRRESGVWHE